MPQKNAKKINVEVAYFSPFLQAEVLSLTVTQRALALYYHNYVGLYNRPSIQCRARELEAFRGPHSCIAPPPNTTEYNWGPVFNIQ